MDQKSKIAGFFREDIRVPHLSNSTIELLLICNRYKGISYNIKVGRTARDSMARTLQPPASRRNMLTCKLIKCSFSVHIKDKQFFYRRKI